LVWNFVLIVGLRLFMLRVVLFVRVADGQCVNAVLATEIKKT